MQKKFQIGWLVLAALLILTMGGPPSARAQESGAENFIFVNFIGQELFLDLDDVTYTVPGTDTAPNGGRLALTLQPGRHKYAANVPGVQGSAGEFELAPGGVFARGTRFDETSPVVREGILIEKPRTYVALFQLDLTAPAADPAPVVDDWQPRPAEAGKSGLAWINHTGYELTLDLNGQIFTVPPKSAEIPGRLQIDVAPGVINYTASIPFGSANGQISAEAGQVTGLSAVTDLPEEQEFNVGSAFDATPNLTLRVYPEDLTAQTAAVSPPAPADAPQPVLPESAATSPADESPVVGNQPSAGLRVENYAGDTLVFTVNNQTVTVAPNAQQTIELLPGEYAFTASTPAVAATGTAVVQPVLGGWVSVVINPARTAFTVYQN